MNWQDILRGIKDSEKQIIQERKKERAKKRSLLEEFSSRAERVCREFARSIRWNFQKYYNEDMVEWHFWIIKEGITTYTIDVVLSLEGCRVGGGREMVSLREFTEIRLAELLKECYLKSI